MPWIAAVMVYIAGLAVAGAFILSSFAERWESGLTGTLTVQVPPPTDIAVQEDARQILIEEVLYAIRKTSGILKAEPLAGEEMRRLLEPWLGVAIDPRDLPLPTLITVELVEDTPRTQIDLDDLSRRLDALVPGTLIDDHGQWQDRLVQFMGALRLVALVLVIIAAGTGIIMVIFATRGGLLAHWRTIELLHLFGARDAYIAKQFAIEAMKAGFKGGTAGLFITAMTVLGLGQGAASTGLVLPGPVVLEPLHWGILALLPAAGALIARFSALWTVHRALAKMI
jgi:cell division transport system permease protein